MTKDKLLKLEELRFQETLSPAEVKLLTSLEEEYFKELKKEGKAK